MHPSPLIGIHSRAHLSAGGHTPLRSEREDMTLHARKHSDSFRPGGAHYPGPVGSALLGTSRRRGLLVPLLCFVGGMVLMYIVLTGSLLTLEGELQQQPHAETAAMPASALTVGALLARGKTPAQLQAELRSSLPICGAHNYGDGEWVYDESITRAPYVSHEWDNVCDAGRETNEDGSIKHIREELKWVWQPRHCRLVPYSRRHFCELLAGRNILFAGDSIAGQHVSSFVHLMSDKPDDLWVRDEYFRHDLMTVCQDVYPVLPGQTEAPAGRDLITGKPLPGVRVGFKRNNFLSLHRQVNRSEEYRKWNTSQAWIQEIGGATATPEGHKGPAYDIIVINTGIWMVSHALRSRGRATRTLAMLSSFAACLTLECCQLLTLPTDSACILLCAGRCSHLREDAARHLLRAGVRISRCDGAMAFDATRSRRLSLALVASAKALVLHRRHHGRLRALPMGGSRGAQPHRADAVP